MHANEIATTLEIPEGKYLKLLDLLDELSTDGAIKALPGQRYRVSATPLEPTRQGILTVNPRGFGFVATRGLKEDLFIPPAAIGGAMHGDTVEARVVAHTRMGLEGVIESIVERGRARVSGVVRRNKKNAWLEPDDDRVRGPIILQEAATDADGMAAVVEITQFPEYVDENPEGRLIEVLGRPGDPSVEVRKVLVREAVLEPFDERVAQEAARVSEQTPRDVSSGRIDLRQVPLFTVDPDDARDHDDAIWAAWDGENFEAWVAIADVASYVTSGTVLDASARERAFSIYLPDRAIPMLPSALSSSACSLVPDEDRLCLAVHLRMDAAGAVLDAQVVEGVMRSRARLTYSGVAVAMKWMAPCTDDKVHGLESSLRLELETADRLASLMRKRRLRRGALDLQVPEAEIIIDASGAPIDVKRRASDPGVRRAYQLIEEFMLAANEAVATWLLERHVETVFRVHPLPDETKLERLAALCEALGIEFELDDAMDAKRLGAFLKRVAKHPLAEIVGMHALRSLKQASYDASNIGHYGLASQAYLHFTSPIRRYPDLLVHRAVKSSLHDARLPEELREERLREIALHCSKRERQVADIEREINDIYRAILMRSHISEVVHGTVVEIFGGTLIVAIDHPFVHVRVPEQLIGADEYEASDDGLRMVGKRSRDVISLGDQMDVCVEDVNIVRRSITGRRIVEIKDKKRKVSDTKPGQRRERVFTKSRKSKRKH